VTGINPDWDTVTIWMCREPIQIHEFVQEATNDKQLSRLGQIPYLDVTYIRPRKNPPRICHHAWFDVFAVQMWNEARCINFVLLVNGLSLRI